jgi:hypothetical protein
MRTERAVVACVLLLGACSGAGKTSPDRARSPTQYARRIGLCENLDFIPDGAVDETLPLPHVSWRLERRGRLLVASWQLRNITDDLIVLRGNVRGSPGGMLHHWEGESRLSLGLFSRPMTPLAPGDVVFGSSAQFGEGVPPGTPITLRFRVIRGERIREMETETQLAPAIEDPAP